MAARRLSRPVEREREASLVESTQRQRAEQREQEKQSRESKESKRSRERQTQEKQEKRPKSRLDKRRERKTGTARGKLARGVCDRHTDRKARRQIRVYERDRDGQVCRCPCRATSAGQEVVRDREHGFLNKHAANEHAENGHRETGTWKTGTRRPSGDCEQMRHCHACCCTDPLTP